MSPVYNLLLCLLERSSHHGRQDRKYGEFRQSHGASEMPALVSSMCRSCQISGSFYVCTVLLVSLCLPIFQSLTQTLPQAESLLFHFCFESRNLLSGFLLTLQASAVFQCWCLKSCSCRYANREALAVAHRELLLGGSSICSFLRASLVRRMTS